MRTVQDIAAELERRLGPLFGSGLHISPQSDIDDRAWQIRVVFQPEAGGPSLGFDLNAPDKSEPITKLKLKPFRSLLGKPEIRPMSGSTSKVVGEVLAWFSANQQELLAPSKHNPRTMKELAALLLQELRSIPGLGFQIDPSPGSVTVRIEPPLDMTFTIGLSPYSEAPSAPGELPMMLKLSGQGILKFRTVNEPKWSVVGTLSKWLRANLSKMPRSASLDRIVSAYKKGLGSY